MYSYLFVRHLSNTKLWVDISVMPTAIVEGSVVGLVLIAAFSTRTRKKSYVQATMRVHRSCTLSILKRTLHLKGKVLLLQLNATVLAG